MSWCAVHGSTWLTTNGIFKSDGPHRPPQQALRLSQPVHPRGPLAGAESELLAVPGVYVAGRLDADSEGLLILTDDGKLQARIAEPKHKLPKTYWVQVEGEPGDEALEQLRRGVRYADFTTLPCGVRRIEPPAGLWARDPPIRFRQVDSDFVAGIAACRKEKIDRFAA